MCLSVCLRRMRRLGACVATGSRSPAAALEARRRPNRRSRLRSDDCISRERSSRRTISNDPFGDIWITPAGNVGRALRHSVRSRDRRSRRRSKSEAPTMPKPTPLSNAVAPGQKGYARDRSQIPPRARRQVSSMRAPRSCLSPQRRSRLRRVSRAFPTGRNHSWSAAINQRCRAGGWSADPCAFPDDPNVARPCLEAIHGCGELARWRLGRPALADASNVAAVLEVLEPSKRLVAVHACRTGGHRRGERARQLGQRGS